MKIRSKLRGVASNPCILFGNKTPPLTLQENGGYPILLVATSTAAFILAAKDVDHPEIWRGLRKEIDMDEPEEPDRFLGCYMRRFDTTASVVEPFLQKSPLLYPRQEPGQKKEEVKPRPVSSLPGCNSGQKVAGYMFDMQEYMKGNVNRYIRETAC